MNASKFLTFTLAALTAFFSASNDQPAWAASAACDADFMTQIYAKAFIEAERETVINNSILLKPDSVLEYTCLDQTSSTFGGIFSKSQRWSHPSPWSTIDIKGATVIIDVNMRGNSPVDISIERLVLPAIAGFVDRHFPHNFLGGAAGSNNTISPTLNGQESVCAHMYNLYYISKCDDFALNAPFMSFESHFSHLNLLEIDTRQLPYSCPSGHKITQDLVDLAKNKDGAYAAFDAVDILPSVSSPSTGSECDNATPIPTGVMVKFVEYGQDLAGNAIIVTPEYQYQDKVCTNPGCYFDNKGNDDPSDDRCVPYP